MSDGYKAKRKTWMTDYITKQTIVLEQIDPEEFEAALQLIEKCRLRGGKIFVIGNGGSASNASHFAQDLGKGASDALQEQHNIRGFCTQSLVDNISWITALGNDYSYEDVFARQLETHARSRYDVLIGISVSGTSKNIVKAMQYADDHSVNTIGLMGKADPHNEWNIHNVSDVKVTFNDDHFGRVEDAMMTFLHMLCYFYIETAENI